jgi:heme-dependent oxidative N-demethylase alpha subunit-like protein
MESRGKIRTEAPIQRGPWSFELGRPLYIAPGDQHPSIDDLSDEEAEDQIHFRLDWQTLRRLLLTGAIAFNFKALFWPL